MTEQQQIASLVRKLHRLARDWKSAGERLDAASDRHHQASGDVYQQCSEQLQEILLTAFEAETAEAQSAFAPALRAVGFNNSGEAVSAPTSMVVTIKHILRGIDRTETEDEEGWWETSTGAAFGEQKLRELLAALGIEEPRQG